MRLQTKIQKAADRLAKMYGISSGSGKYFKIKVEAIAEKDKAKAVNLESFLNLRYNQLYHKL